MLEDVWVEVDLGALKHNLRQVQAAVPDSTRILAVAKGNGFGHGYIEPSRAFIEAGASALGVTRLDEAMIVRSAGITAPILLFAPIQPENAADAVEADLEMTVTSAELALAIDQAAASQDRVASVHVKVDTGMGRLGLASADVHAFFQAISGAQNLRVAGIYTHFATAPDKNLALARRQLDVFFRLLQSLRAAGIDYGLAHAANSAAILRMPDSHLDMVRPGTLLYGQYPSQPVPRNLDLKNTWRLKARICDVRDLPAGTSIGYGAEFRTTRSTRAAVIPIGYADGYTLVPEGPVYRQGPLRFLARKSRRRLEVEVRGAKAPVLGRVAMQMIVVDVTGIAGVRTGDEVSIPAMRVPTSALIPRRYAE